MEEVETFSYLGIVVIRDKGVRYESWNIDNQWNFYEAVIHCGRIRTFLGRGNKNL